MAIRFLEWNERQFLLGGGDWRLTGQNDWCSLIPLVHRALISPDDQVEYPAYRRDMPHQAATTYWEAACHVLYLLLGWADAGKGLQAWYQAGKPTEDARLAFLRRVYDGEGQLDLLARQLWERGSFGYQHALMECARRSREFPERRGQDFMGRDWIAAFDAKFPPEGSGYGPYYGGSNSLHLGHGVDGGGPPDPGGLELLRFPADRRAVLLLDRGLNWYRRLYFGTAALPDLGEHSWHLEVVVKPMGSLGTFRQSRETGLWFQGKHSVHMMGN